MAVNISKVIPTNTQIELLRSDLLSGRRDINTFVHKGEVGLCRVMDKDESYSSYLTGGMRSVPHLINNARTIAQKIVDSMCNIPVKVTVGNSTSFTTKERHINVATDYFDDNDLSTNQKTDILIGLSIHEASHVNNSDLSVEKDLRSTYNKGQILHLAMNIWNIIEDERIEMITGEDRPGYADFLGETKKYYFDKKVKERPQVENSPETEQKVAVFINDLIKLIRFPAALSDEDIINDYELLAKAKDILTPFPASSNDVIKATVKIIDLIRDIIKEEMKKQQEQNNQTNSSQPGQNQSSQGQSQSSQTNDKQNEHKSSSSENSEEQKQSQSTGKQDNKTKSSSNNPSKEAVDNLLSQVLDSKAVKKEISKMDSLQTKENAQQLSDNGSYLVANGLEAPDKLKEVKVYSNTLDKERYFIFKKQIQKHIPALKKAMRLQTIDKEYNIEGQQTGKINSHKLSHVAAGNFNIFTKMGEERYDASNVCLLIDESGSMNGKKNDAAILTAVLIQETLQTNPKTILSVFGYSNQFYNYIEANKGAKESLAKISSRGSTPTGDAMLIAAKKIRNHNKKPCLMIVITDGVPNDSSKVINAEKTLSKDGFVIIGVGIERATNVETIFKNSIVLNDLSELATNIGKLIKQNLKLLIKPIENTF